MDIEWFTIKGYEGLYEWSPQLESVRGLKSGKVKQWKYNTQGRPFVSLWKNGKGRNFFKAMVVYSHAHQVEIPLGYDVHHIDGCKDNNSPSNLQLLSREVHKKLHAEELSKAVVAVDENNNVVYRFASTCESDRHGFNQGAVSTACRGCYSTHKGHFYKGLYWYYEEEWLSSLKSQPFIQQDGQLLLYF